MAHVVIFEGGKADMSKFAALMVAKTVDNHPSKTPRILFPTGTTPLGENGYFAELIKLRSSGKANTEGIRLVSGDEYHGIPQSNPGSFCTYLTEKVINPLGMSTEASLQLNGGFIGMPDKADEECRAFENNLRLDPCELAVLGLGTNGHVAFNDPPSDLCTKTRRLKLTEGSVKSAQADFPTFSPEELPTEALSVGLSTLKECCKLCIVLVVGARKQEIVKQCLRSDQSISPSVPASQLRYAKNFMFFMDRDAAKLLLEEEKYAPRLTIIPKFPSDSIDELSCKTLVEWTPSLKRPINECSEVHRKAIVVADVGGTNGRIRIYLKSIHDSGNRIDIVDENPWFERIYRMALFNSYSELASNVVKDVLSVCKHSRASATIEFVSGCFAVCGPVTENGTKNDPNNLWPGKFEYAKKISKIFGIDDESKFKFINDFESIGHSLAASHSRNPVDVPDVGTLSTQCRPKNLHVLHPGQKNGGQVIGCMGAGTGLGLVFLTPALQSDGSVSYHVFPSEGGMGDTFSPRNQTEWNLKQFLMKKHGEYIEIERIVSGPGLADVYRFLLLTNKILDVNVDSIDEDKQGAYVSSLAESFETGKADNSNELSRVALEALDLFLDVYGRALGASALTLMCFSGLYIAGGILSKVLWRLKQKNILVSSYLNQGPKMSGTVSDIPLILIKDPDVGLLGALKVGMELNS
eukprot:g4729.t1